MEGQQKKKDPTKRTSSWQNSCNLPPWEKRNQSQIPEEATDFLPGKLL